MKTILACLVVLALGTVIRAGDLDAPATKQITVRSEIERGYAAALSAVADTKGPMEDVDAFLALGSKNEQARTDTDGFMLGLSLGEWRTHWQSLSLDAAFTGTGKSRVDVSDLTAKFADAAHTSFRNWAKKCGLSDAQLKEVFGSQTYDPALDEPAWAAAMKAKQFKASMPKR